MSNFEPAPRRARAVLFDLDGTLLDTAPDLIGSLNVLRLELGLEPMADSYLRPVVSHGSAPMIQRGFNLPLQHPEFEPLRQRFLDIYRNRVSQASRAYEGIDEVLATLDEQGMPWAVVTNKPGWLTEPLLEDLGYRARAACVVSGDTLPCRKPDPAPVLLACSQMNMDPADCVMIGDAQRDIEAGHRAGTLTLAALFGYIGGEDRVACWGADGLIAHPLDILRWVDCEPSRQPALPPRSAAFG